MKANPGKHHLLLSDNDSSKITIENKTIYNRKFEKPLGIKIDNNLNLKEDIESLCKTASQKISALSRLASSMNFEQRRLEINYFVICNFWYCPIVWMIHSQKLNARITRLTSSIQRFWLIFWRSTKGRQLQSLTPKKSTKTNEISKIGISKNWNSPELIKGVFQFTDVPQNLRNQSKCNRSIPCTERYGIKTASSTGLKLRDTVTKEIKNSKHLEEFKRPIKTWVPK